MKTLLEYLNRTGFAICGLLALYLLNPFGIGFLFGYLLVILIFLKKDFISNNLDLDVFLLFLFSIVYAIFYAFDPVAGNQFIVIYALFPSGFYLLGKFLVRKNTSTKTIFLILFVMASIFSFSAVISVFLNFREGGFAQLDRTIPMFWNNMPTSATIMGSFLTLNMCIPAILIASYRRNKIFFNIFLIGIFALSLLCAIRLGSRTQLVIFIMTSVISLFYTFPKQSYKQNIILLLLLGAILAFVLNKVSFNLNEDWLTTFAGRMEGGRGGDVASGGGRTGRWIKSLEYLFTHPLGWDAKEFGYSHNMWFDVLRVSGIIPFIVLIVYSVRSFLQIKKSILINPQNISLNIMILIYAIGFLLIFTVEPIFEGIFSLFIMFCVYKGVINKYYINCIS